MSSKPFRTESKESQSIGAFSVIAESLLIALLMVLCLLLAGCGSDPAEVAPATDSTRTAAAGSTEQAEPHGYVAGAEEAAEPQARLTAVGPGGEVTVTDPEALQNAKGRFPELNYEPVAENAIENAHALVLLTEWKQYLNLDPAATGTLVADKNIIDGRNALDSAHWRSAGWNYKAMGRP